MSAKIYEIIPYNVEALKWERDNWDEVVEFLKAHNTEIRNVSRLNEKNLDFFRENCIGWTDEKVDNNGRYAFDVYRPSSECSDEYEEFVEMGDYLVVGKDGLIYVKKELDFDWMFREKKNV